MLNFDVKFVFVRKDFIESMLFYLKILSLNRHKVWRGLLDLGGPQDSHYALVPIGVTLKAC